MVIRDSANIRTHVFYLFDPLFLEPSVVWWSSICRTFNTTWSEPSVVRDRDPCVHPLSGVERKTRRSAITIGRFLRGRVSSKRLLRFIRVSNQLKSMRLKSWVMLVKCEYLMTFSATASSPSSDIHHLAWYLLGALETYSFFMSVGFNIVDLTDSCRVNEMRMSTEVCTESSANMSSKKKQKKKRVITHPRVRRLRWGCVRSFPFSSEPCNLMDDEWIDWNYFHPSSVIVWGQEYVMTITFKWPLLAQVHQSGLEDERYKLLGSI